MNNNRLFFKSLKLIFFVKFHLNILVKPMNCVLASHKMCSTEGTGDVPSTNCSKILFPPAVVKGMKELNTYAFNKNIKFPVILFSTVNIKPINKMLLPYYVKLLAFRPVQQCDVLNDGNCYSADDKCGFLNPDMIKSFDSFDEVVKNRLQDLGITEKNLIFVEKQIGFFNWNTEDIIKAILPENLKFSGYSIVGHIAHMNLREELLEYKYVIGYIILNKVKNIKTVVNKIVSIENTFRTFEMELICGDNNMVTRVKENFCTFELNYAKVYWNSRLSTEHERILRKLNQNDMLYDVFAGVGPFTIPAAKKGCFVLCNDLNNDAVEWLKCNLKLNKIYRSKVQVCNKDAKQFILDDMKEHLMHVVEKRGNDNFKVHITMNLPATAVMYLNELKYLFTENEYKSVPKNITVHIYCFIKNENKSMDLLKKDALELVERHLNEKLDSLVSEIVDIRNVAPKKVMFRVSFSLSKDILVRKSVKRPTEPAHIDYVTPPQTNV